MPGTASGREKVLAEFEQGTRPREREVQVGFGHLLEGAPEAGCSLSRGSQAWRRVARTLLDASKASSSLDGPWQSHEV